MQFLKKYPFEVAFSLVFIIVSAVLNTQFLEGSNVNYVFSGHDEYLTVREVYSILNPASFKHFIMAVISGDVLLYGRMMFYTDALLAYLPYKIWGITGMVYAIRMTHVFFLVFGISLLSRTFLKTAQSKLIFLLAAFSMYFTAYFVMVPKPEPLQLFLIALFLKVSSQKNWMFGKHFILLGMAYGVKFNILTLLPLFYLLPFLAGKPKLKELVFSGFYFLGGLLVAIPCLLLSPVKPIFLRTYLSSTFGNTRHYDDENVTVAEWFSDGWSDVYLGGIVFGLLIVILIIWMLFSSLKKYLADKKIDGSLIILLCGLGLLLPVMLFTKRLWSHYLWTANVLLLAGLAAFIGEIFSKRARIVFTGGMVLVLLGYIKASLQWNKEVFSFEKNRMREIAEGQKAYNYLESKGGSYVAVQDISVFFPFKEMLEVDRYHPFASKYPYPEPKAKYLWPSFIHPRLLKEKKANFLLVCRRDFENMSSASASDTKGGRMSFMCDSMLHSELGKTIFRDTVFGKLKVYRIVNDGP